MPEIHISVAEKIAQVSGTAAIVCGNSDYTVRFTFDAEWSPYPVKTARFVYMQDGTRRYRDVLFSGSSVTVPAVHDTDALAVGVYAGDLHTSTSALIPCMQSITDGAAAHNLPADDVYTQLLEYLASAPAQSECAAGIAETIFCGSDNSETGIAVSLGVVEPEPLGKADMMQHTWEQGSAQDSNGAFTVSSTKRLRCLDYIDIPDGTVSMVVRPLTTSGEQMMLCLYFYKETNAYISYKGWVAYGTTVTPPSGAKKVRIILRKQDTNAEVAVDELESCGMTFYDY